VTIGGEGGVRPHAAAAATTPASEPSGGALDGMHESPPATRDTARVDRRPPLHATRLTARGAVEQLSTPARLARQQSARDLLALSR
jgi:hypothetical protein